MSKIKREQIAFIDGLSWALTFISHPNEKIREDAEEMIKAKIKEVEQELT